MVVLQMFEILCILMYIKYNEREKLQDNANNKNQITELGIGKSQGNKNNV
jgi:hypothetical protein